MSSAWFPGLSVTSCHKPINDLIHILDSLSFIFMQSDEIMVIEVTAERLLLALENGVSQYPAMEGRFPCGK